MTRCAVVGDPIAHSLSPALHRAGYDQLNLAATYDAVRVEAGTLAARVADDLATLAGISVTAPLKREALELADTASDRARSVGAANTLVRTDGTLHADNTDIPGAIAAIGERSDRPIERALILGGGATAGSLGFALVEMGCTSLELRGRDRQRSAEALDVISQAGGAEATFGVLDGTWDDSAFDLVISTIPAAAQGQLKQQLAGVLARGATVFEVIYDPWPTPLAQWATDARVPLVSGLDLLAHQAVLQFESFTGHQVDVDVLREAGWAELERRRAGQ